MLSRVCLIRYLCSVLCVASLSVCGASFGESDVTSQSVTISAEFDVAQSLNEQIDKRVGSADLESKALCAVYIFDGATGKVLVNKHGEEAFAPASCNKLLTTAASLSLFGPDKRIETDIYRTGVIDANGTLKGNLIVVGGGDPSICGRYETDKKDVTAELRRWVDAMTSAGIKKVHGDLVADIRVFDQEYFHKNWYLNERGEYYEAEIWGLQFNEGCVDMEFSSKDLLPGDTAKMTLIPPTTYATVSNNIKVLARGRAGSTEFRREDLSNDIVATGTLAFDSTKIESATICNGPLWALHTLRDVMTSAGITVSGKLRIADSLEDAPAVAGGILVHRRLSPPMSELINTVNRVSQNFYADSLCKLLGNRFRGSGSWAAGCAVIREWLRNQPVWSEGHMMDDGSGLSDENRVAPRTLAELQRFMNEGPYSSQWRDSLPQGGVRGSLKARFAETDATAEQKARIFGKTGYIDGVRSLCGYILRKDGTPVYYMINVVNSYRSAKQQLDLIDDIVVMTLKAYE
ncbi:D-alanyl-D-alanine carboxypeptidase/D-alanyl-D-alanine-endopeptidase [Candidatus Sumerlaeota bacterium]|nr:D-alanyl-D-alanine carboxypeptidase/D-alanyl-D-alanine-endopeptidase [Candidatus Sumerlaeota bacterium]